MRHISKAYPGVQALDSVDFELLRGEIHALAGENGAGKSTLIKIIMGVVAKDKGTIELDGVPVTINSPRQAWEHGISAVYQELSLVPHLTVADNIFLGREPANRFGLVDRRYTSRAAQRLLDEFSIPLRSKTLVSSLSFGYRQLVEIVKALSVEAKIIILDEPTSSLTSNEEDHLFATLAMLKQRRVSIIYISHKMTELYQLADRITVIRDGKNVGTFAAAAVNPRDVIAAITGEERSDSTPPPKLDSRRDSSDAVLAVQNLTTDFVKNISFSVQRGEIVGIGGLLDSGKADLAKAIFGVRAIRSGTVLMDGQMLPANAPDKAIARGIMLVPEDRAKEGVSLDHSVEENINLPILHRAIKYGFVSRRNLRQTAWEQVRRYRIATPDIEKKLKLLSGGNQQKVVIAKSLATTPHVLILIEPTQGVDVGAREELHGIITDAAEKGLAVVVVSSDPSELSMLCHRVLILHKGALVAELQGDQIASKQNLIAAIQKDYSDSVAGERSAMAGAGKSGG